MSTSTHSRRVREKLEFTLKAMVLGLTAVAALPAAADPVWMVTPVPANPGSLTDVVVPAAKDAWAVGFRLTETDFETLALRWDGLAWKRRAVPQLGRANAVAARSANEVWVVGDEATARWDGLRWKRIEYQAVPNASAGMYDVTAVGATDVWAVGTFQPQDTYAPQAQAQRWDGSAWKRVPVPVAGESSALLGIDAFGGQVWAVGYTFTEAGGDQGIALRWSSGRWISVPVPTIPNTHVELYDVKVLSSNAVWAVGWSSALGSAERKPLAMYWDGARWKITPTPGVNAQLNAVTLSSVDGVIAVGYRLNETGVAPYALKWTGSGWVPAATPSAPGAGLFSVDAAPDGRLWTVGFFQEPGASDSSPLAAVSSIK
ncbi:MAG TPA: hypothetical protein VEY30_14340 [Myxococcaceae bacterium]|nr:hypothetical protein [Myxococcaceae bacterium]